VGAPRATGTATVLFTDLVASTRLRTEMGDDAADQLRRHHDEALRATVDRRGGTVVKGLGDGLLATFGSAAEAVAAAVEMQQAIARLNRRRRAEPVAIRIGVSAGDVTWDGGDCFGEPVIEAGRLCAEAEGGQILCSDIVRALARRRGEHEFQEAGELDLKGLPEPVLAWAVAWHPEIEPAPPLVTLATRSAFPFVGRERERDDILTAWKQAMAGERRAVLLAGEPGVGKTRLAAEMAALAAEDGGLVLAGRCDEEVGSPYQPFAESLRRFVDSCPDAELGERLGPGAAHLAVLVPGLRDRLPDVRDQVPPDDDTARLWLFEAVVGWLAAASAESPLLLVVDDLHWAAKPTLLLLRHLLRHDEPLPLLVVATYRDTDLDRAHPLVEVLADLRRAAGVQRLPLRGLGQDEVRAFLAAAAGHDLDEPALDLARTLHAETEGNPFFMTEVLTHLIETGVLYVGEDGRWSSRIDDVEDLGIPEGVREVVGRRLSRQSEACNRVLALAAVLGPEFEVASVAAMAGEDVLEPLEQAAAAGLIAERPGPSPAYAFTHALVRQTLLEELSLARRQQYHLRAAEALSATTPRRPGPIAAHYRQAGATAEAGVAVAASLEAAEAARRALAWEEASDHWEGALELLDLQGGDPTTRARLYELLGDAMYATGRDWERGIDQLERAIEIHEGRGDAYSAAKVRSRIGRNLATFPGRTDPVRAMAHLRAAEPALRERGDSPALAYLELGFSTAHTFPCQNEEGLAAAERALAIGERLGHEAVRANAKLLQGWHLAYTGRTAEGLAIIEEGYADGVRLDQPILAYLGTTLGSGVLAAVDDRLGALEWIDRELAAGRLTGATGMIANLRAARASHGAELGRLDEAAGADLRGDELGEPFVWFTLGRWDAATELADAVAAECRRLGNRFTGRVMEWIGAEVARQRGDLPTAAELHAGSLAAGFGSSRLSGLYSHIALVRTLAEMGEHEQARRRARALQEAAAAIDDLRGLGARLAAALGAATLDDEHADALFTRAIEVARRYELPFAEVWALDAWATRTGRVEHLDVAAAVLDRIGAGGDWVHWLAARRSR
jgi:class 3 adenylate cyclase